MPARCVQPARKGNFGNRTAMMSNRLTFPANAYSPDADRDGTDASARLPEWLVHLIALVIRFILERSLAARSRRCTLPPWWHDRPDLPAGSVQQLAAWRRGAFGNAIAWMCRRRGIGPGHPDWPYLCHAIVAFGGSVQGFRAGLPACGLQWFENPDIVPGMTGEDAATPAATALALLLSRQEAACSPPPTPNVVPEAAPPVLLPASWLSGCWPTASWRRNSTGPPAAPGAVNVPASDKRGQGMAGPAVLIRPVLIRPVLITAVAAPRRQATDATTRTPTPCRSPPVSSTA
jgi:hypothetical protein